MQIDQLNGGKRCPYLFLCSTSFQRLGQQSLKIFRWYFGQKNILTFTDVQFLLKSNSICFIQIDLALKVNMKLYFIGSCYNFHYLYKLFANYQLTTSNFFDPFETRYISFLSTFTFRCGRVVADFLPYSKFRKNLLS